MEPTKPTKPALPLALSLPLTLSLEPGPGRLWLDFARLRTVHTFGQGSTRAGKSWLLRWMCEQLFGQVQQLVFDVEGEYVSLTEKFDYALFSADTPVALSPEAAPLLMRRLLEMGTSAILDLSDLTTEDQQNFVRLAATELVRVTTKAPRPVMIVIDEVQRLAPQAGQGEATSTAAIRDLANRGLKRGLFLLLASQRHSAVDAAVRGAMANVIVGGTPPGLDMETAGKKLGFDAKERRSLADLKRGDFYFLGPAFGDEDGPRRVQLARSGPIQTHHMNAGEARAYTPPPASEAVQSLYENLSENLKDEQLADLPGHAKEEVQGAEAMRQANETLRAKNKALETENAELVVRVAALEGRLAGKHLVEKHLVEKHLVETPVVETPVVETPGAVAKSPRAAQELPKEAPVAPMAAQEPPLAAPAKATAEPLPSASPIPVSPIRSSAASPVTSDQVERTASTLAEVWPYRPTPGQLCALAGVEVLPAQEAGLVRVLRRKGVAVWEGGQLTSTHSPSTVGWQNDKKQNDKNWQSARVVGMTPEEYRRRWERVLGTTATRLISELAEAGAEGLTWRDWLDRAAYADGGRVNAARARLLALGLVAKHGSRFRAVAPWLAEDVGQPLLVLSEA